MASQPYPDRRRGVWLMKWRPDPTGKWVVVNLGKDPRLKGARPPRTPPQVVIDRAREFEELEYRARHGIAAAPARARPLAAYLESYLEGYAALHKAGSLRQARRHLGRFREFAAGRGVTSVQGVTRALCRDYLEARAALVAHDTLRTEVGFMTPPWTRAVEDGLMAANPWARIAVPGRSTRSDPVFWSGEEIARIAARCVKPWQSDLVLVLANTGLRISTALAMRWGWVDWADGLIRIPADAASETEGIKTSYVLAMNRVSRDILQRRMATAGGGGGAPRGDLAAALVFPNPYRGGGEVPYDSAREAIARAIRRAGVKPGTPHDLRHSYARALDRSGVPASVVQSQLGHASAATTRIYTGASAIEAARYLEGFGLGDGDGGGGEVSPPPAPPGPAPPAGNGPGPGPA